MITFPTLHPESLIADSTYSETQSDTSIVEEMDGGYEISRPLHTRPPTSEITFSIPYAKDSDKTLLKEFWASTKGRSEMFEWYNFMTEETLIVRFAEPITYNYVGFGESKMWEITIKLKEV